MIFLVTYKEDIEAVFFHIWDAQQHINFFSKEEQDQMEIVRIDEHDVKELQGLKDLLQTCNKRDNHKNHCCGNCGCTSWKKGVLLCNFTKEEANPNDYCTHYI